MLSVALWVLEQEYKFAKKHFTYTDPNPEKIDSWEAAAVFTAITAGSLQTSAISFQPYYGLYKAHAATQWAVRDTLWTQAVKKTGALGGKFNTYTFYNLYPRVGAFAQKGGWRFAATKVGSRFIPYVGWALLAYDLYKVGKWVGRKVGS